MKLFVSLAASAAFATLSLSAFATMVMHMDLADLVGNADKVYRGTVLEKEPGTVSVGGGQLSTVTYKVRVDDALKGEFGGKDNPIVVITMIGDLKDRSAGAGLQRFGQLDINPDLDIGQDYVLFTTAPSSVGLSTTVGLDQGLFRIFANEQGREMAANGVGNQGLFNGAVSYEQLKTAIYAELD